MKVAVVEPLGLDNLSIVERPEPRPGDGEVLVRLRAASLNYRDLLTIEGGYGTQQKRGDLVPLSDGAGEVAEVGAGVTRWQVGDRVVGCFFARWDGGPANEQRLAATLGGSVDGTACEYRVFGENAILPIPAHLDFVQAATLPCAALTAWVAVIEQHAIGPSNTVLTQGTGGVALFAVQFAAAAGAGVIATSSTAERLEQLRARRRATDQLQGRCDLGTDRLPAFRRRSRSRRRHRRCANPVAIVPRRAGRRSGEHHRRRYRREARPACPDPDREIHPPAPGHRRQSRPVRRDAAGDRAP